MATLEKIRSRSVVLLVVIGLALLAFIIGDFFTSGRTLFGTGTTVAKVGGNKIDIREYQNRLETASQQAQQSGRKIDNAVLQQQVLDQLIAETLFNEEIKNLGLTVSDGELSNAMVGPGAVMLDQLVRQQTGFDSAAMLHDAAFNPSKYQLTNEQAAQLRNYWLDLETQMEQTLMQQKFQTLFSGVLVANELDAKALYDEGAQTAQIVFAKKDYASLPDSEVGEITDADIAARYAEEKGRFRLNEPMRRISYINLPITPSAEDRAAAQQRVDKALEALTSMPETIGLAEMTDFVVNRQRSSAARVSDTRVRSFLTESPDSAVKVISSVGDRWKIAKLMSRGSEVDSVSIDVVALEGSKAHRDSLLAALNAGTLAFDSVAALPGVQGSQKALWVSLLDPQMAQVRSTLLAAPAGRYFTPDTMATLTGGRIFRVNERKAPVTVYDYAVIDYTVDPSAATLNKMQIDLNKFLSENKKAADFVANAEKAGYMVQQANVTPSTAQVGGVNDSRGAVIWAMQASKGDVSDILGGTDSGHFMAVAVEDIYKGDFAPATDPGVRSIIEREVINDRKAAKLIEQFAGKATDIAGYAAVMGTGADTTNVSFAQFMIPKLGMNEAAVTAAAVTTPQGKLVGPMQGEQGVVVFEVTGITTEGLPYDFTQSSTQYARSRGAGALGQQINNILRGNRKVTNNLGTFYNHDAR